MSELQDQVERTVKAARYFVDELYPGASFDADIFDVVPTMTGFATFVGNALTLTYVDYSDSVPGQWVLQVSSGLATYVPDVKGSLVWANNINRTSAIGKYYCCFAPEQEFCAIVYESIIWGGFFATPASDHAIPVMRWLKGMLRNNIQTAAEQCKQLQQSCGGRLFESSDLISLFTMTSG